MTQVPSVLVIDDQLNFHTPLSETFSEEIEKKHYDFNFAKTGLEGLEQARKIINRQNSLFIIDIILPDIPGEKLIQTLDEEKTSKSKFKGIIISAHKTIEQLQELKAKYNWIIDYFPKPIDSNHFRQVVNSLCQQQAKKFNYDDLDTATASFIRQQTGEIKLWMKQTILGAIESGEKLIKIKQILEYGQFLDWLGSELQCHHNTALGLMKVARVFGPQRHRIADSGLSLSVLYILAQGNIDSEMREDVIQLSEGRSKPISLKEIKEIKTEYENNKESTSIKKNLPISSSSQSNSSKNPHSLTPSTSVGDQSLDKTNKLRPKQQILKVLPQNSPREEVSNKFWQLSQHLLFCGHPNSSEFIAKLPPLVDLTIAFPPSPNWDKQAIIPVTTKSTAIFQTHFTDCPGDILRTMIRDAIELYTENGSTVLVSFLPVPDFNLLNLVNVLGCRCFIAEPDRNKCQQLAQKAQHFLDM